jgi:hypothetical protein
MKESEYMSTKEIPSIKAQLKGVTDKELSKETLLRDYFNGQDRATVYTVLRSVSSSGMTRHISLKVVDSDGDILDITYLAARALGDKLQERNGFNTLKVNGCGMDMGFHIVYSLSSVLFAGQERAGYKIAQRWI